MTHITGRPVRRMLHVLAAAAAVLLALPPSPARADAPISGANLSCSITFTVHITPGLSALRKQPQHVDLSTRGLTGTATCTGAVDTQTVTGPGQFGLSEADIADCVLATGHGTFVLRIPTTGGTATLAGKFTSVGSVVSGDFSGTGQVLATEGNCFTGQPPLTSVTVVDTVHVGR
jgi:hypothetical protein